MHSTYYLDPDPKTNPLKKKNYLVDAGPNITHRFCIRTKSGTRSRSIKADPGPDPPWVHPGCDPFAFLLGRIGQNIKIQNRSGCSLA